MDSPAKKKPEADKMTTEKRKQIGEMYYDGLMKNIGQLLKDMRENVRLN